MLATHFLMLATLIVHAGGVKIHHEHHEPFADQDLTSDSHAHCVIFTTSPIWTINMTVLTQWHNQMGWAQSDGMGTIRWDVSPFAQSDGMGPWDLAHATCSLRWDFAHATCR